MLTYFLLFSHVHILIWNISSIHGVCSDLAAADTGVPGPSEWAVWCSAHGFTGSSVEQQEK